MDGDYGMTEFFSSVDAVLLGRRTHAHALRQHPPPRPKKR